MDCKQQYFHTLVIGSGCAGFNALDWLYDLGVTDTALITEGINKGTSRNTGSDKQTYYKLTLSGDGTDSVYDMACTLFEGGGVHGDTAMTEAACSVKAFMKLTQLGVPFPTNEYGAYVGYKTDHDPRSRATSCGPLTSKLMTEALERSVASKPIPVFDQRQVIKLLVTEGRVNGLVALNTKALEDEAGTTETVPESEIYEVFLCENIILATGGPAGVYSDVVYPKSQTGATGLALEAGAKACNLNEWQYGLASVDFRWNVSGTYQQVLPRYISVDGQGNAHEFLLDYYKNPCEALDNVFLKGYQWPFDPRKASSQIDLLVAREMHEHHRTVYMDFRINPKGLEQGFDGLSSETRTYLERSGALFGTPIERLLHMNPKAVDLYRAHGIDLLTEPLKVAVCAQHCNGGIAVDTNWESTVKGLYVAGEAAGTFGVYRPGGSALNATQVGSMRAAEHIARKYNREKTNQAGSQVHLSGSVEGRFLKAAGFKPPAPVACADIRLYTQRQMSQFASYKRNPVEMRRMLTEFTGLHKRFFEEHACQSVSELPYLYKSYDILVTQIAMLSAMLFAAEHIGSRGGALVDGVPTAEASVCVKDAATGNNTRQAGGQGEVSAHMDKVVITQAGISSFEPVRPLPVCDDWFENVWRAYELERNGKA